MTTDGLSRRHALTGAAAAAVGVPLLAACGDDASGESGSDAVTPPSTEPGQALGSASDVPVGGGKVYRDQKVVVTQPRGGEFKAFSAVCTHQGCVVKAVTDGSIDCACHGSRFSIEDGSVERGPATSPLGEVTVSVEGGEITTA